MSYIDNKERTIITEQHYTSILNFMFILRHSLK